MDHDGARRGLPVAPGAPVQLAPPIAGRAQARAEWGLADLDRVVELIDRCSNRDRADLRPPKVVSLRQGNNSKLDV